MNPIVVSLPAAAQDRHPHRWYILVILSICLLMVCMDNTLLHTAVPSIILAVHPSAIEQLWIINSYALVLTGLLITMGALGDCISVY